MLHRKTAVTCAVLALLASGAARAAGDSIPEDCFNSNDESAYLNDLEPGILRISDADVAAVLAEINASEKRRMAERRAREAAQATAEPAARPGG